MKPVAICLFSAVQFAVSSSAIADQVIQEVRGWKVIHSDEYKGCVAVANYQDGTRLRFGIDGIIRQPFINFSNPAWMAYPINQNFEVMFDFGGRRFSGYFRTTKREGIITFENADLTPQFIEAFMAGAGVKAYINGTSLTSFVLSGTKAAWNVVLQCSRVNN